MYCDGNGIKPNLDKSFYWCRKVAKSGFPSAQTYLGIKYLNGLGVKANPKKALKWFTKAVDDFGLYISRNLTNLKSENEDYFINLKILDYKESARICEKEQENVPIYYLSSFYRMNVGSFPKDLAKSYQLMRTATEGGSSNAGIALASMIFRGEGVLQKRKEAFSVLEAFADKGHSLAQYELAELYLKGKLIPKNLTKSIYWLQKAAAAGMVNAQTELGIMYFKGDGVEKDTDTSLMWLKKAVKQNDSLAMFTLGEIYYSLDKDKCEFETALSWYLKAGNRGYQQAFIRAATIYLDRNYSKANVKMSRKLLNIPANAGNRDALRMLGVIYMEDIYGLKNYEKAEKKFRKAITLDDDASKLFLAILLHNEFDTSYREEAKKLLIDLRKKGNDVAKQALYLFGKSKKIHIKDAKR
jgi:TPR repeat protein